MKKVALSLVAFMFVAVAFAQKAEDIVKFKELKHDFGKIKQGVPVTYEFEFKNASAQPVVIESATASCGCTTPVKPEGAIAKGKTNKITAGFNAGNAGPFDKTIYVKVAGVAQPMELRIVGEVLDAQAYAKYESEQKSKKSK